MSEKKDARRLRLTGGDRIVAYVLLGLLVVTLAATVLNMLNLRLVAGEIYLFLPMIALLLLLGWGVSALWRRIKNKTARRIVGAVLIVVMALLLMLTMTYTSVFAGMNIPRKYAVVSDSGHSLVVMRTLDTDEARIAQRHEARLAADPDGDQGMIAEDFGFVYTAYAPAVMGLFYKPDTLIEGEVHIGYASKAELMVEWEDDVGHFFIKNPETGDEGEMRARS